MKNQMDLYSTLSALLGKKISPYDELSLSEEEWERLSASEKDQIAQLLEAAILNPTLMFPAQGVSGNAEAGHDEISPVVSQLEPRARKLSDPVSERMRSSESLKRGSKKVVKINTREWRKGATFFVGTKREIASVVSATARGDAKMGQNKAKPVQEALNYENAFERLSKKWDDLRNPKPSRSRSFKSLYGRSNVRGQMLFLKREILELQAKLKISLGIHSDLIARTEGLLYAVNLVLDVENGAGSRPGLFRSQERKLHQPDPEKRGPAFRNWPH